MSDLRIKLHETPPGDMQRTLTTGMTAAYESSEAKRQFVKEFLNGFLGVDPHDETNSFKAKINSLMNLLDEQVPFSSNVQEQWQRTDWQGQRQCRSYRGNDDDDSDLSTDYIPPMDPELANDLRRQYQAKLKYQEVPPTVFEKICKVNSFVFSNIMVSVKWFLNSLFCEGPLERTAKVFDYIYDVLKTILTMDFEPPLMAKSEQKFELKSIIEGETIDEPIVFLLDRIALCFYFLTQPAVRKAFHELKTKEYRKEICINSVIEILRAELLNPAEPFEIINGSTITLCNLIRINAPNKEAVEINVETPIETPMETSIGSHNASSTSLNESSLLSASFSGTSSTPHSRLPIISQRRQQKITCPRRIEKELMQLYHRHRHRSITRTE